MTLSERIVEDRPLHVKTATRHWLYDAGDGLYHPRGDSPKVFGKRIRPCSLAELIARHGRVEIVED